MKRTMSVLLLVTLSVVLLAACTPNARTYDDDHGRYRPLDTDQRFMDRMDRDINRMDRDINRNMNRMNRDRNRLDMDNYRDNRTGDRPFVNDPEYNDKDNRILDRDRDDTIIDDEDMVR